jgi:membrane protein required for colicin V production
MNWVDYLLLALLVVTMIFGTRRGVIREVMGLVAFGVGIVFATHYIDWLSYTLTRKMALSPVLVSFVGFVVLVVFVFLVFRILALLFYRIASVGKLGKVDHVGGALAGLLRGWLMLGFLLFLILYLPLPQSTLDSIDDSFLAPGMRNTVPVLYEATAVVHPSNDRFIDKVRAALNVEPGRYAANPDDQRLQRRRIRELERAQATIQQMEARFDYR